MSRIFQVVFYILFVLPPGSSVSQDENDSIPCTPINRDSWIARDKARHFTVSALLAGGLSWSQKYKTHHDPEHAMRYGIGMTLSLGFAKELADGRKPGGFFSWKDLVADVLGAAAGMILLGWW